MFLQVNTTSSFTDYLPFHIVNSIAGLICTKLQLILDYDGPDNKTKREIAFKGLPNNPPSNLSMKFVFGKELEGPVN
jgi:hypothetical protein